MKAEGICICIAKHVKNGFFTSNYELDRPWPKRKHKKWIGLMKDELDRKTWDNETENI